MSIMGKKELKKRKNWQNISGTKAELVEKNFYKIFLKEFKSSNLEIRLRPKEFNNIYSGIKLTKQVLANIYRPNKSWTHGVFPDFAIDNIKTKKTLYVEVKRQDGWVEGKPSSAGRGNAHERSCKFFTPGLLKILRKQGKLGDGTLPFWTVFQGDIARDPKRVREITCWYAEYSNHFFMWSDTANDQLLIDHFNQKLKPLLV